MFVKCEEAQWLAVDEIDGRLPADIRRSLFQHLQACPTCRRSYELGAVARLTVRRAIPYLATPVDLRRSVLQAMANDRSAVRAVRESLGILLRALIGRPVLYSGLATAVFLAFIGFQPAMVQHAPYRPVAMNVVREAAVNLELFRTGQIKPAVVASRPDSLCGYLHTLGAPLASCVKSFRGWDWYGGSVTEHEGIKLTHLVCRVGSDYIYIFGVREDEMERDGDFALSPSAWRGLATAGWYATPDSVRCPVVMWKENNTLCAAASTMKKADLLHYLASR